MLYYWIAREWQPGESASQLLIIQPGSLIESVIPQPINLEPIKGLNL